MTQDKAVDLAGLDSLSFDGGPEVEAFLSSALKDGLALADDGFAYNSVQDAVDAASGWVFVGPGTFNEAVTISTSGLLVQGVGRDTLIDGGTDFNAITINASNVTVKDLSLQTTAGEGTNRSCLTTNNSGTDNITIKNVVFRASDEHAVFLDEGNYHKVINCTFEGADGEGVRCDVDRVIIANNNVESVDNRGFGLSCDDSIVVNNVIQSTGGNGIGTGQHDNIFIGNQQRAGFTGIFLNSNSIDNIVANNQYRDNSDQDLRDAGTGNVTDGNIQGTSN